MTSQNIIKVVVAGAITIYVLLALSFFFKKDKKDHPTPGTVVLSDVKSWALYVNSVKPDVVKSSPFQMIITSTHGGNTPFTKEHVDLMKANGSKKVLAYLSIGQAERYRNYWISEWDRKKPSWMGPENRLWKNQFIITNLTDPVWQRIAEYMIDAAIENNFDGALFTGIDSYRQLKNDKLKAQTVTFINQMASYAKKKNPKFIVLVDDVDDLIVNVDGIVKHNLVYDWRSNGMTGPINTDTVIANTTKNLNEIKARGQSVFVIEYVSNELWKQAKTIVDKHGYVGYSGPRLLDTLRIAQ